MRAIGSVHDENFNRIREDTCDRIRTRRVPPIRMFRPLGRMRVAIFAAAFGNIYGEVRAIDNMRDENFNRIREDIYGRIRARRLR